MSDALAGLHAAHEALDMRGASMHVVHRDVSPQNILVDTHGMSSIIDFGIAKAGSQLAMTGSGVFKGTFRYMAPEQVKQQPLDRRADVFSAGVVLYEALTGRGLFRGDDEGDTVLSVLVTEIPDPSSVAPAVSKQLDAVAREALERRRDRRFATAAGFREALETACPPAATDEVASVVARLGGGILARRREALQLALARSSAPPSTKWLGRRRVAVALMALLVAAALTTGAVFHALQSPPRAPPLSAKPSTPTALPPASSPPSDTGALEPPVGAFAQIVPPPAPRTPVHSAPRHRSIDLHRKNPYASP
jgi:serine/threonine-protein kinase